MSTYLPIASPVTRDEYDGRPLQLSQKPGCVQDKTVMLDMLKSRVQARFRASVRWIIKKSSKAEA
eukprot:3138206-Pyramimonas_sp.AAC.1